MPTSPVRFEEIAYNYGFVPVDPSTNRGYCPVYRLFKECVEEPGRAVLVRGNEKVIQIKDISGPLEDREKFTIFCQDIVDYYPFNFRSKAVGFLIEARKRSKTGYWFIVFQREGQLAAFCSFLYWLIYGRLPRHGRSLSPHQSSRSSEWYPVHPIKSTSYRHRSRHRPVYMERYGSNFPDRSSVVLSNVPSYVVAPARSRSRPASRTSSYFYNYSYVPNYYYRYSVSTDRSSSSYDYYDYF
ncbi:hypothetical protein Aperf_G00000022132 [Anoplocephala perfoliata]